MTSGRALLVEDGESRIALGAARSLARAGWQVGVAGPRRSLASSSRSTTAWHRVPRPGGDLPGFVAGVRAAVDRRGYDLVFGVGDAELLALSAARDELGATVPYAAHDVVLRAVDKAGLAAAGRAAGLRVPAEHPVACLSGVRGDVVVKPRLNGRPGSAKIEARRFSSTADAAGYAAEVEAAGGSPVVQEAVDGALLALVVLLAPDGGTVALVQQRAERIFPPRTGISTRARTEPVDPALAEPATRMLRGLGWWGLAELQFVAPAVGPPALIDLNGRFYGSLALACAAGVDLPDLWARLVTGRPVPRGLVARPGVAYQWLEGDLRRALAQSDGRLLGGGLLGDVAGCLRAAPGAAHSVWHPRDPAPLARQLGRLAVAAGRKAATRSGVPR